MRSYHGEFLLIENPMLSFAPSFILFLAIPATQNSITLKLINNGSSSLL